MDEACNQADHMGSNHKVEAAIEDLEVDEKTKAVDYQSTDIENEVSKLSTTVLQPVRYNHQTRSVPHTQLL